MSFAQKTSQKSKKNRSRYLIERLEERTMMTTVVHSLESDFTEIRSSPEVAWSVNAGQQELSPLEDPNIQGQTIFTGLKAPNVRQFRSASDLDFTGDFVYAINAGGSEATIGDVTFSDGSIANGTENINARYQIVNWYPDADYGDSPDDDTLETVMESIRWERSPGVSLDLEVEPGQTYKLQMLFAELWTERGFDVYMDDARVYSNLAVYAEQGEINRKNTGVVFTHEFIAQDDQLTVQFKSDQGFPNTDNYLQAFTLEKLGAPFWLQLEDDAAGSHFEGFDEADVLVMPTLDGSGYGAANVTWTSPADTMISLAGGVWTMDNGGGDFHWRLDLNGEELTSGTLLANQFTEDLPFDFRSGSGGAEAVRNLSVEEGQQLRLTVTGSGGEFVAVDLSVTTDSLQIPRYPLGEIPAQDGTSGEPIRFIVEVSALETLSMSISGEDVKSRASLNTDGLFEYTPDTNDGFDHVVTFEVIDDGVRQSQQVTIRTNEIQGEFDLVAEPGDLPDVTDYAVVSDETLAEDVFFNALPQSRTRRVEISGKQLNFIPGEGGLLDEFAHTGGTVNTNIEELHVYAETVVIGGKLWLPGTDVTIYAKELIFQDDNGTAEINTTPLGFQSAAAGAQSSPAVPGENGGRGQDGGNITLHVAELKSTDNSEMDTKRFIMHGGAGQEAGAGLKGRDGVGPEALGQTIPKYIRDCVPNVNLTNATYLEYEETSLFNPIFRTFGSKTPPTDGTGATPGGVPGQGGNGGQFTSSHHDWDSLVSADAGAPGAKAKDQPAGARATTPQHLNVRKHLGNCRVSPLNLPVGGQTGFDWIAPSGEAGSDGGSNVFDDPEVGRWQHPATMKSMISYARDVYLQGHHSLAAELFNDYGNQLDEAVFALPDFAAPFAEMRAEVNTYEHQLANQLDFFGNPAGWAPTLSFAANYTAFQTSIDSDLKTLLLTRKVQDTQADLEAKRESIDGLIQELDASVSQAKEDLKEAQQRLPDLRGQLQDILEETRYMESELEQREAQLASEAQSNVSARNILSTIGGLLSVVPIPTVAAVGTGLSAVNSFVAEPTLAGAGAAAKGLYDPFKQETLEATSTEIDTQMQLLEPLSDVNSSALKSLGNLGAKWAPVVSAFHEVTLATQVPSAEIEAELQKLRTQDSEYGNLIARLENLLAEKETFASKLAQTMNAISANLNAISSGYTSADTLNQQRNMAADRELSHATLEQVSQMEQNARDRLLRYQYNMAKAFEYETLTPYQGDFLSRTFEEIDNLLETEESNLDLAGQLDLLRTAYEQDLSAVQSTILERLGQKSLTSTSTFTLTPEEMTELNTNGEVAIRLLDKVIDPTKAGDVKIVEMGVLLAGSELTVADSSPDVTIEGANVRFEFEHSGQSVLYSDNSRYGFQHLNRDGENEVGVFWTTDYDANPRAGDTPGELRSDRLTQSAVSEFGTDAFEAVISDSPRSLYTRPGGIWTDIKIRAERVINATKPNPTGAGRVDVDANVEFTGLTFFVEYDSDNLAPDSIYLLDVQSPEGTSPRILIDHPDASGRTDGEGSFVRFFDQEQDIVLTAESTYGGLQFAGWLNNRGEKLSDAPTLTISLSEHTQLRATYAASDGRLAGDADSDGEVSFSDFLILANNFGRASDVAFADGDFDASGEIDFADFLILAANFGRTTV